MTVHSSSPRLDQSQHDETRISVRRDQTDGAGTIEVGCDVICQSGEKLGEVVEVQPTHVVIEKGFFVPEDWYVPNDAIASVDDQHVTLKLTKNQAEHAGWDHDPQDD